MRDVRRIGRRTWLARLSGGALAVVAGLKFGGGRDGYGIQIGGPDAAAAPAPGTAAPLVWAWTGVARSPSRTARQPPQTAPNRWRRESSCIGIFSLLHTPVRR